jgi:hypothetical protein
MGGRLDHDLLHDGDLRKLIAACAMAGVLAEL